jgi:putative transposase
MKKSRFSEERIIAILKQAEAGVKVAELVRRHGISEATFYNWKARYGGLDVSQLRRLKELEAENARLKKMYAELSLAHHALQDAVQKPTVCQCARRAGRHSLRARRFTRPGGCAMTRR